MIHEILPAGALECNCSIFGDEASGEAIVVDPGDGEDLERISEVIERRGWKVRAIVITHAHIDHVGGAAKLKARTGAPVWMNERDEGLYGQLEMQAAWLGMRTPERTGIDVKTKEGDTLALGSVAFHVLETPGHTQGSVCLFVPAERKLIAGDTLFRDSIGRTDLPGGDGRQILKSIHTKLMKLPEETLVVCGHGPETTIGREKELNPFLQMF